MTDNFRTLENCIYEIWCGEDHFSDPQSSELYWALREGINRMKTLEISLIREKHPNIKELMFRYHYKASDALFNLKEVTSRKNHDCSRCGEDRIKNGQEYFQWMVGEGYTDYHKLCARCVAFALYANKVWNLPEESSSYWDKDKKTSISFKTFEESA